MKAIEQADQARFIVGQFLHYSYLMQPERLTEQERTVLIFYYTELMALLKASMAVGNTHR